VADRGRSLGSVKSNKLIRLSKSCLSDAEKRAVMGVLDRDFLGMGAEVQLFEERLSEFFGRRAVCVVNGTAALHLALQAAGIGQGDEVLVQSLTYVASFQAISATGAIPVACDVNELTLTLDLQDAEKRLTPNTKAVMPVHYSGGVGELDEIYAFARKYGLRVIEDAAHAFGTQYQGKYVGGFGDIACFSFDGVKNITSGEGGCIVTDDPNILLRVQDARLLGVERDTDMRYLAQRSWEFDVPAQGWRYHMSNIMAAIGIEQLKSFPKMAKKRQRLACHYDDLLSKHQSVQSLWKDYTFVVPHIYVVRIKGMKNRKLLQEQLLKLGIQTGVHYQPNHLLSLYKQQSSLPLDCTDSVFSELLTLPLHPGLNKEDVDYVIKTLMRILI
jgi:dTDP-4-amino-4,6-dideoxygalactose transaminase